MYFSSLFFFSTKSGFCGFSRMVVVATTTTRGGAWFFGTPRRKRRRKKRRRRRRRRRRRTSRVVVSIFAQKFVTRKKRGKRETLLLGFRVYLGKEKKG
tara:strand:- start:448 stop:741 length:294 start_codon:yes stop_codon:yes gene_type:complete